MGHDESVAVQLKGVRCLSCEHENAPEAKLCSECGSRLDLRLCAQCEAINEGTATHCHACGETLTDFVPEQPSPRATLRTPSAPSRFAPSGERRAKAVPTPVLAAKQTIGRRPQRAARTILLVVLLVAVALFAYDRLQPGGIGKLSVAGMLQHAPVSKKEIEAPAKAAAPVVPTAPAAPAPLPVAAHPKAAPAKARVRETKPAPVAAARPAKPVETVPAVPARPASPPPPSAGPHPSVTHTKGWEPGRVAAPAAGTSTQEPLLPREREVIQRSNNRPNAPTCTEEVAALGLCNR